MALLLFLLLRGSLTTWVVLLDQSLNLGRRSADKLVGGGGVAVLENVEGGHGLDIVLGGQLGEIVDIDLDEVDVGVLVRPPVRVQIMLVSAGNAVALERERERERELNDKAPRERQGGRLDVLSNLGSYHLARTAPGREPVDKHDGVLGEGLLEVGGAAGREEALSVTQIPGRDTGRRIELRNSLFDVVDSHLGQRSVKGPRKSKSGSGRQRQSRSNCSRESRAQELPGGG